MKKISKEKILDFCKNNMIRVTDENKRGLGSVMLKIFNQYGAVDEKDINGLQVRIRLKTFSLNYINPNHSNPLEKNEFCKLFLYIDKKLIGTMSYWTLEHQHQMVKFHIDEDDLYEYMFLLKLAVD